MPSQDAYRYAYSLGRGSNLVRNELFCGEKGSARPSLSYNPSMLLSSTLGRILTIHVDPTV